MKRFSLFLICIASAIAEPPGIEQSMECINPTTGGMFIRWHGKPGRSYFLQVSDPTNHLNMWKWAPIIERGNDVEISYDIDGTADKGFFRLKYADQVPGANETLDTADYDNDGLSNIDEVSPPQAAMAVRGVIPALVPNATDPLNPDTDGDWLPDGWEKANGLEANDPSDAMLDYDLDGNSNAQEFQQNTDPRDYASRALPLIEMYDGDEQVSSPSSRLPIAMSVRVTDSSGLTLSNVPIQFNVTSGSGLLARSPDDPQPASTLTLFSDENGLTGAYYIQPNTLNTPSSISATVTSGIDNGIITFTTQTVASLPANNNFADAQLLTGNEGSVNSTNRGASIEPNEPTFLTLDIGTISPQGGNIVRQTGATVWFTWQAPETRKYRFQTGSLVKLENEEPSTYFGDGTDFDTVLAVYQGTSLQTLTLTAGNDDSGTVESGVEFNATEGQSYYIAIDGAEGQIGKFYLSWLPVPPPSPPGPPPANDEFVAAEEISGFDGSVIGATIDATKQSGEPDHQFHGGQHSVWYSWQSSETGTVAFDTVGSEFNTIIGIYQGSTIGSLSEVGWNDDNETLQARVSVEVTAGQTYLIMVEGFGADAGPVRLSWHTVAQPPANDNFGNASPISDNSGTMSGTIRGATDELGEPVHAGSGPGQSIWYQWTASESETYTFRTTGSEFDTVLAVYTGSTIIALTEVASNDDGNGLQSVLSFDATQGTTYFIVIDVYSGTLPWGQSAVSVLNWMQGMPTPPLNQQQSPDVPIVPQPIQDSLLFQASGRSQSSASATESEGEPNKGDTFVSAENATIILLAPKENESPVACPYSFEVEHSIVTYNTPRERDLTGKLRLLIEGDSSLVSLGSYTPGTPINVTEPGHVGDGIHDWHRGSESFNITGLKKGTLTLRAEVDPDSETPEGDGEPRIKATINVQIVEVSEVVIYDPSTTNDSDWLTPAKKLRWSHIMNKNEPLKIKLILSSAIPADENLDLSSLKFAMFNNDENPDLATWIDISNASRRLSPSRNEVWVTVDADTVAAALIPLNSSENEFASIENIISEDFTDADAFDAKAHLLANSVHLVNARVGGNDTENPIQKGGVTVPPYSATSVGSYSRYGGASFIQVVVQNTFSKRRLYRNQADILYISGHASERIAGMGPGLADWGEDLDIVIISGCSALNINDYNGNYDDDADGNTEPGPTTTVFPGEQWAATGPKTLLGYNYKAPLDSQGTPGIINTWFDNRGSGDINAWKTANYNKAGRNACAIDAAGGVYYYFHRTKGTFQNSYKWTGIPKSAW